jgi:hypothetical protein
MRRRITLLVAVALVMVAMLASSALPASAEPISQMSCRELAEAAERSALKLAFGGGGGGQSDRLDELAKEAERKGCGEYEKVASRG